MAEKSLRLRWLETFLAVVDSECVEAKAAKALGMDASSVNRHISHLEYWLHRSVFDTETKQLTQFGLEFQAIARRVVDELNNARADLTAPKSFKPPVSGKDIKMKR